jgi:hypothetical protein
MRYRLILPRDKSIQAGVFNGELSSTIKFDGKNVEYVWEKKDIEPAKGEKQSASSSDYLTKLVVATLGSWEEKSRWFYSNNEPQLESNEDIKKKVDELTERCRSEEEKISIMTHWVAQEIRYLGLSMGKGEGYTVHQSKATFHEKEGVCKDKAALLVTMLRAAGIEAYLAMTMSSSRVENIPADQFNHAVVALRKKDGGFRLLDPTWGLNSRELWSSAEQENFVLIGTAKGEDLSQAPYIPPQDNQLEVKNVSSISEDGTLRGYISMKAAGYYETRIRRTIAGSKIDEKKRYFERTISQLVPSSSLLSFSYDDPEDFAKPFSMKMKYEVANFGLLSGKGLFFRVLSGANFFKEDDFIVAIEGGEKRKTPIRLGSTRRIVIRERTKLPAGYRIRSLPQIRDVENSIASFRSKFKGNGSLLSWTAELEVKKRSIPPECYSSLREAVKIFRDLKSLMINAEKTR